MANRKAKLPTFVSILKLRDAVEYYNPNGDDVEELMFYANRMVPISKNTLKVVVKPRRAQLKKFIAASTKYVQAMETVLTHLENNLEN